MAKLSHQSPGPCNEGADRGRKSIVVLATLDTKGPESQFLREQIEAFGDQAILVDAGVIGRPAARADVSREAVAEAGGVPLARLLEHPDRERAAPVMADGAARIISALHERGEMHAIIGLGGTQGTTLCTKVMRALPYGVPKIMVSTMASGNVSRWVDIKDITMMFSVADILGLNRLTRKILANAAGAACGAAHVDLSLDTGGKPLVAVTTVGITTQGAMKASEVLAAAGYETITFHAIGAGGRAMEQLMREGVISAVLDYATIEISNQMFDGLLAADDARLTTAGTLGLPQVLCPGAVEVIVFGPPETVPAQYRARTMIRHSPQITDIRLNRAEMVRVAEEIARRLQHTKDEAVFMIPTAGYDSYAVAGNRFYDPEADRAFAETLRAGLPSNVRVIDRDTHIDDPAFATEAAEELIRLIGNKQKA
jgi:uncharacterized protein (UPF0261 family)